MLPKVIKLKIKVLNEEKLKFNLDYMIIKLLLQNVYLTSSSLYISIKDRKRASVYAAIKRLEKQGCVMLVVRQGEFRKQTYITIYDINLEKALDDKEYYWDLLRIIYEQKREELE